MILNSTLGLCGEKCPKCRICEKSLVEKITDRLFGLDISENQFIELVDCGHTVQVSQLDTHVQYQVEKNIVQMISCPQCLTPIRKTVRYHSYINECLRNIEKVKKIMRGQDDHLRKMTKDSRKKFEEKLSSTKKLDKKDKDILMKQFNVAFTKKNIPNSQHHRCKDLCIRLLLDMNVTEKMIQEFGNIRNIN